MPTLDELCNNPSFPALQQEYFWKEVERLKYGDRSSLEKAAQCLNYVWNHYDSGGHSCGRSWRSFILEQVIAWLRSEIEIEKEGTRHTTAIRQHDEIIAKKALSVLIAMYFDYGYINRSGWYDYPLDGVWDVPLDDRIHLCAAAILLDVREIPNLADWPKEKVHELMEGFRG